jgi:hypothetical protein
MQKFDKTLVALTEADIFVVKAVSKSRWINLGCITYCLLIVQLDGIGVLCVNVSGMLSPISVFVAISMRMLLF